MLYSTLIQLSIYWQSIFQATTWTNVGFSWIRISAIYPAKMLLVMLIMSNTEIRVRLHMFRITSTSQTKGAETSPVNTLRPMQNDHHFTDDILKCIFLNENVWIPIKISLKFVPGGTTNNIPSQVQIMAWRRPGDKPLSEPMMVSLLTHIYLTRTQGVDQWIICFYGRNLCV